LGSQPPPKTPIAIISVTGKATNFKFGQKIAETKPMKNFGEKGAIFGEKGASFEL